jgi:hypothetical protein
MPHRHHGYIIVQGLESRSPHFYEMEMAMAMAMHSQAERDVYAEFGKRLASMLPKLKKLRREYIDSRFDNKAADAYLPYRREYCEVSRQRRLAARFVRKVKMPSKTTINKQYWDIPTLLDVLVKTDCKAYRVDDIEDFKQYTLDIAKSILSKASKEELVDNLMCFKYHLQGGEWHRRCRDDRDMAAITGSCQNTTDTRALQGRHRGCHHQI